MKRLARYLKRERQLGQVFEYGKLAEELTVFTDSDWAGCKETRKSSSASVLMLGGHTVKAYTRKQKVIAKSSAEAELCAAALGATEAKGVQSMMCDLGFAVKPMLNMDAKATERILHRQGIGKLKHVDVAYMWVQDEIISQRLRVHRVRSEENVADLGTKPLSKAVIAKHCVTLGYVNMNSVQQSARSGRQQVTMSRHQSAEICSNRSSCRIRSSRSKHREIARDAKEDVALFCLRLRYNTQINFGKYRQGESFQFRPRRHHHGRHRALPLDRIQDKFLFEHHEEIFGKPHKSTRTYAVDGFDLAEKMPPVGIAHEARNPNAE